MDIVECRLNASEDKKSLIKSKADLEVEDPPEEEGEKIILKNTLLSENLRSGT